MRIVDELVKEAEKSLCKKRKVGAIIVDKADNILSKGHNYNPDSLDCEDVEGETFFYIIHAEIAAINALTNTDTAYKMYITHPPCDNCLSNIKALGLEYEVVPTFMKFDTGKLRYSLIPPIMLKALANVLTYGAKKYKPNNWQGVDDVDRYWDALYRHLEARRDGEMLDSESKLPHLWHAITNIGFILFLDDKSNK